MLRAAALALIALLGLAMPAAAQTATTGPFGLRMGQFFTASEMDGPGDSLLRWNSRYSVFVPRPHPDFPYYMATVPTDRGLCEISGYGELRPSADNWAAFLRNADALTAAYGPSEHPISRMQPVYDPQLWSYRSSRPSIGATWVAPRGKPFKGSIASISMSMTYDEGSTLSIHYEFANGCPSVHTQGVSLIVARVVSASEPRRSLCRNPENCGYVRDNRFGTLRMLAGALVPPTIDYVSWSDKRWEPGQTVVLLLDRAHNGSWFLRDDAPVQRGRACLETEWLDYHEIVPPGRLSREGDKTCFRVRA